MGGVDPRKEVPSTHGVYKYFLFGISPQRIKDEEGEARGLWLVGVTEL